MDHKQVAKVPFLCPLMCILWANIVDVKNPIAHAATSSCKMQLPLSQKKKEKEIRPFNYSLIIGHKKKYYSLIIINCSNYKVKQMNYG